MQFVQEMVFFVKSMIVISLILCYRLLYLYVSVNEPRFMIIVTILMGLF